MNIGLCYFKWRLIAKSVCMKYLYHKTELTQVWKIIELDNRKCDVCEADRENRFDTQELYAFPLELMLIDIRFFHVKRK